MKLSALVEAIKEFNPELHNFEETEVLGIGLDSKKIKDGYLFCAVKGQVYDAHDFVFESIKSGAKACLVSKTTEVDCPQVVVEEKVMRKAVAKISRHFYGYPDKKLKVVGVTGTNGKTSVVRFVKTILEAKGINVVEVGTLTGERTTPEAPMVFKLLKEAVDAGAGAAVMEVSSHALYFDRIGDLEFEACVFTNLTEDHLDFHKTMKNYFEAKKKLFEPNRYKKAIIFDSNIWSKKLVRFVKEQKNNPIIIRANDIKNLRVDKNGISFVFCDREAKLSTKATFNAINASIAIKTCEQLGISMEESIGVLKNIEEVPGRFNVIKTNDEYGAKFGTIVVDFAHSDDALKNAINSARALTTGEVIVVFGAGGNRDRYKRKKMGQVVGSLADIVIITSDNPRDEDPEKIAAQIMSGITENSKFVFIELDRREAIKRAIKASRPGDVVLIAGKGHEKYQEIAGQKIPFDDSEIAFEILRALTKKCA